VTKPRLSRRQAQTAELMRKGLRPAQIAAVLGVSVQTAKNHMSEVYRRFGIAGDVRGKQLRFIEQAGAQPIQPSERKRIVRMVEVRQLQCATSEEIDHWRAAKPLTTQPLTTQLMWRFCIDACHEWCVERRVAGKCIRNDVEYQRIVEQRDSGEERAA
jgi:hypothetical protein